MVSNYKWRCISIAAGALALGNISVTQGESSVREDRYRLVKDWPALPKSMNGGNWGEVSSIDVGPDGNIWIIHRCFNRLPRGGATCIGQDQYSPILQFDPSGKFLKGFGNAVLAFVHGSYVDHDGNVWVTDANVDATVMGMSAQGKGSQVVKFSPAGKVLMRLGKAGVRGEGAELLDAPTDVVTAANGDIFVTDGHFLNRVIKFSKEGKFLQSWGKIGSGPGELHEPHAIAIDSQGRIFVGDRQNGRIAIFDQEGKFLDEWSQFGRPSGLTVGPDDTLYVTDSTTNSTNNPGHKRGIYIGSARRGEVTDIIPDPDLDKQDSLVISGATGIAAGLDGSVYAGDIGPHGVRKYEKVKQ